MILGYLLHAKLLLALGNKLLCRQFFFFSSSVFTLCFKYKDLEFGSLFMLKSLLTILSIKYDSDTKMPKSSAIAIGLSIKNQLPLVIYIDVRCIY
jgi:hypothetical protein